MSAVLYRVTFAKNDNKRLLHIRNTEAFIANVHGIEDVETFRAYHLHEGKHLVPDYAAIRAALPHIYRKAFDRAGTWFFPVTMHSMLSGNVNDLNAAKLSLWSSKSCLLGTIRATPFLS